MVCSQACPSTCVVQCTCFGTVMRVIQNSTKILNVGRKCLNAEYRTSNQFLVGQLSGTWYYTDARVFVLRIRVVRIFNALHARTILIALKTRINSYQRNTRFVNIHMRREALMCLLYI